MAFVTFSKQEFEDALASGLRSAVDSLKISNARLFRDKKRGGAEYTYLIYTGQANIWIKVFSSVDPRSNHSRDNGEDAVRFMLIDRTVPDQPVALLHKQPYMQRIHTWKKNLSKRLHALLDQALVLQTDLCSCGSAKVEKKGQNGPFMGCANWRSLHGPKATFTPRENRNQITVRM